MLCRLIILGSVYTFRCHTRQRHSHCKSLTLCQWWLVLFGMSLEPILPTNFDCVMVTAMASKHVNRPLWCVYTCNEGVFFFFFFLRLRVRKNRFIADVSAPLLRYIYSFIPQPERFLELQVYFAEDHSIYSIDIVQKRTWKRYLQNIRLSVAFALCEWSPIQAVCSLNASIPLQFISPYLFRLYLINLLRCTQKKVICFSIIWTISVCMYQMISI